MDRIVTHRHRNGLVPADDCPGNLYCEAEYSTRTTKQIGALQGQSMHGGNMSPFVYPPLSAALVASC